MSTTDQIEAPLAMTAADLIHFMESCGHKPVLMSF